ncbi:zinc finger MYM-type protein 1-like [Rhopalosiphum padi]|uniref:zinc finger MYM-type protein 1-like n=1 Tax=Rhopalosiphum padi TaxID=40932 RepID=UPI00298DFA0C|nr:zinc finger MYM-type protein 1-like [Rhopalosiphum padi]
MLMVNDIKQGHFRALLKYRAKGDDFLRTVLEGLGKRNKYTSPVIQNEIVQVCNTILLRKIVNKVNKSKCFSVLADETTDISTKEQLSICVRYIDEQNMHHEDFLQFFEIESLTSDALANSILNGLIHCGLDCNYLYGQGYDGASNMAGQFKGVQTVVRSKYPKALYVHCAAHSLNLAVSTASGIKPIRNCLGLIEKVYTFFNTPKRNSVLLHVIENSDDEPSTKQLKRLCATRWIQRYDSVKDFSELFPFVLSALEIISDWKDPSEARMIKKSMEDTEFIISFNVIKLLFSFGLPLCKQLQKVQIDLGRTIYIVENMIATLKSIRENSEVEFCIVYNNVKVNS